jgi:hypothetical protein
LVVVVVEGTAIPSGTIGWVVGVVVGSIILNTFSWTS